MTTHLTKDDTIVLIRALKAAQTETIQQGLMLSGIFSSQDVDVKNEAVADDASFGAQILDAVTTAQNHVSALGHIIKRLESP